MDSILIMRALQKLVNASCNAGLACPALDAGIRCLLPPTPLTEGGTGESTLTEESAGGSALTEGGEDSGSLAGIT